MPDNKWYVITGGPSTGKTTLLELLKTRGYATVPEVARTVIDRGIANGHEVAVLRADEKAFQEEVAREKAQIEIGLDNKQITFFDRGMQDTVAYLNAHNYVIDDWVDKLMQRSHYNKVFVLEPLADYSTDYARTEDESIREQIQPLLLDAYAKYDMKPVLIPALSVGDRVNYILDVIKEETE